MAFVQKVGDNVYKGLHLYSAFALCTASQEQACAKIHLRQTNTLKAFRGNVSERQTDSETD